LGYIGNRVITVGIVIISATTAFLVRLTARMVWNIKILPLLIKRVS